MRRCYLRGDRAGTGREIYHGKRRQPQGNRYWEHHNSLQDRFHEPSVLDKGDISGSCSPPYHYFRHDLGRGLLQKGCRYVYQKAVLVSSMVPMGWVIGCPLLGAFLPLVYGNPRLRPAIIVMIARFAVLIFLPKVVHQPSPLIFGIALGCSDDPLYYHQEANPENVKGSATGGINFFTFVSLRC